MEDEKSDYYMKDENEKTDFSVDQTRKLLDTEKQGPNEKDGSNNSHPDFILCL